MESLPSLGSGEKNLKLTGPEKITSLLLAAGIGILAFTFWGSIVPFVVATLVNTWVAVGLGTGLLFLVFLATDKDIRRSGFVLWKLFTRSIAGTVVTIDPIGVMKIAIESMKKRQETLSEQITVVSGQKSKIDIKLRENNKTIEKNVNFANAAVKQGNQNAASLAMMEAAQLRDYNQTLSAMLNDATRVMTFLSKLEATVDYFIKDNTIKVRIQEDKYKMVKSTNSALRTAVGIFKGNSDEAAAMLEANDYITEDMGRKVGEINRYMDQTKGFVENFDINNMAYQTEGMELLDKFNKGELDLFGTINDKPALQAGNVANMINLPQAEPMKIEIGNRKFNGLLDD